MKPQHTPGPWTLTPGETLCNYCGAISADNRTTWGQQWTRNLKRA
jgi:hypothetical protein